MQRLFLPLSFLSAPFSALPATDRFAPLPPPLPYFVLNLPSIFLPSSPLLSSLAVNHLGERGLGLQHRRPAALHVVGSISGC